LAATADATAQGRYVTERFVSLNRDFSPRTPARRRMLVIGDSYAQDFVNASVEVGVLEGVEVRTSYISADCQIYFGAATIQANVERRFVPVCDEEHASPTTRQRIREADVIVLVSSWREWAIDKLPETLRALELAPGQEVFVVGTKSFGEVHVRSLLKLDESERVALRQSPSRNAVAMNARLGQIVPKAQFIDMLGALCDEGRRCPLFNRDGELLSFDGTHLTRAGAVFVGKAIWAREPLATWARATR